MPTMPVSYHYSKEDNEVTIGISGKFDFSQVTDFKNAYADNEIKGANYTIDLRETEHMDSSALGMLLNMRKHLGGDTPIRISNTRPQIKKILTISRFDKKFSIN
jgi:anti-anti-sigma factor